MSKGRSTSTLPMATAKGSTHGRSFSRVAATLEVYVAHTRVWGGREGRREGGREGKRGGEVRGGEGRKGGKEGREGRADLERVCVCVCVCVCVYV